MELYILEANENLIRVVETSLPHLQVVLQDWHLDNDGILTGQISVRRSESAADMTDEPSDLDTFAQDVIRELFSSLIRDVIAKMTESGKEFPDSIDSAEETTYNSRTQEENQTDV